MKIRNGFVSASQMGGAAESIDRLRQALSAADAVLVGAGAGLSTSAGLTYSGARFRRYFADFERAHGFHDMYSGGFYPYQTLEEHWAFWSRSIYVNRFSPIPRDTYDMLRELVDGKDYFVLTTNVDHCFQRTGFDKRRLFYTQGDYGLWQCMEPCCPETHDNEAAVREMLRVQGFTWGDDGSLRPLADGATRFIPRGLVPHCPHCGQPLTMNLRVDGTFVEDAGWHAAQARYHAWVEARRGARVVLLELGVGGNTPAIIKYPFWQMAAANPRATYACINLGEAFAPAEIADRAVYIDADITQALRRLAGARC